MFLVKFRLCLLLIQKKFIFWLRMARRNRLNPATTRGFFCFCFCFLFFVFCLLFCFGLFCFGLFCFGLACFGLFCFVLFCFILFYFILFYFILFYFILFYFILFYFILFYFILFYFILFYFILFKYISRFIKLQLEIKFDDALSDSSKFALGLVQEQRSTSSKNDEINLKNASWVAEENGLKKDESGMYKIPTKSVFSFIIFMKNFSLLSFFFLLILNKIKIDWNQNPPILSCLPFGKKYNCKASRNHRSGWK